MQPRYYCVINGSNPKIPGPMQHWLSDGNLSACDLVNYCTKASLFVIVIVESHLNYSYFRACFVCFPSVKEEFTVWLFSLTPQEVLMEAMENETWKHSSYVPHYLLRGDPFASRLSKEADIVAALYICIIGQ